MDQKRGVQFNFAKTAKRYRACNCARGAAFAPELRFSRPKVTNVLGADADADEAPEMTAGNMPAKMTTGGRLLTAVSWCRKRSAVAREQLRAIIRASSRGKLARRTWAVSVPRCDPPPRLYQRQPEMYRFSQAIRLWDEALVLTPNRAVRAPSREFCLHISSTD